MIIPVILAGLLIIALTRKDEIVNYVDEHTTWWTRFDDLFQNAESRYGIKNLADYLKTTSIIESDLGRAASVALGMRQPANAEGSKSSDGLSWGIMQMTLVTAKDFDKNATVAKLNDPTYSVDLAAQYYKRTMTQFSSKDPRFLEWVVKSYNQGAGNTLKEIKTGRGYAEAYWQKWQSAYNRVLEAK